MKKQKSIYLAFLLLFLVSASCAEPKPQANAQKTPQITVSPTRIVHKGWVQMQGTGFTPKLESFSHLRRSDGREFPVLPMFTNERGEFKHDIDTLLLAPGVHELWVVDGMTGLSSNIARFDVVLHE